MVFDTSVETAELMNGRPPARKQLLTPLLTSYKVHLHFYFCFNLFFIDISLLIITVLQVYFSDHFVVAIALSGGELFYFELDATGQMTEVGKRDMGRDVACLGIAPISKVSPSQSLFPPPPFFISDSTDQWVVDQIRK
jgi:hypothetical protein